MDGAHRRHLHAGRGLIVVRKPTAVARRRPRRVDARDGLELEVAQHIAGIESGAGVATEAAGAALPGAAGVPGGASAGAAGHAAGHAAGAAGHAAGAAGHARARAAGHARARAASRTTAARGTGGTAAARLPASTTTSTRVYAAVDLS